MIQREDTTWLTISPSRRLTGQLKQPDINPPNTVPVHKPNFLKTRQTSRLRATWLGHACYYIEFPGGLRVLFDPVFTERCSPVTWYGPVRYTKAPCQVDDIPIIDAVVISHNHYDHLSYPTIMRIKERHPNIHFFVPLGLKKWFTNIGIHNVSELDWWQSNEMRLSEDDPNAPKEINRTTSPAPSSTSSVITATFNCLPCQHTTARTAFDKNSTLWSSWSIESGGQKVWFAGDTGYRTVPDEVAEDEDDYDPKYSDLPTCPVFKQIGDLRGPFDLGLIPIGAYLPRALMSPMHANPYDSVNIFLESQCKRALGMHWGTWVLTEEPVLEPPILLKKALKRKGLEETGVFDVCDIGESREFGDDD